jgi:hypothetical protein
VAVDFADAEGVGGRALSEAHEGVHQGQLLGVVELEARNALAGRGEGRFGEPLKLAAVDKGLEDVLLDVEIAVVDRRELVWMPLF